LRSARDDADPGASAGRVGRAGRRHPLRGLRSCVRQVASRFRDRCAWRHRRRSEVPPVRSYADLGRTGSIVARLCAAQRHRGRVRVPLRRLWELRDPGAGGRRAVRTCPGP
jgi:hypothetical protein